jgi:hypothetical protein
MLLGIEDVWQPTRCKTHPGIFTEERSDGFAAVVALNDHFEAYLKSEMHLELRSLVQFHQDVLQSLVHSTSTDSSPAPVDSTTATMSLPEGIKRSLAFPFTAEVLLQNGAAHGIVSLHQLQQPSIVERQLFIVYMSDCFALNDVSHKKRALRTLKMDSLKAMGYEILRALTIYNEMPDNECRLIVEMQISLPASGLPIRTRISDQCVEDQLVHGLNAARKQSSPGVELVPVFMGSNPA